MRIFKYAIFGDLKTFQSLTLGGELTAVIHKGLKDSAKRVVDNPALNKHLDDLVKKGELDEAGKKKLLKEISHTGGTFVGSSKFKGMDPDLFRAGRKKLLQKLAKIKPGQIKDYSDYLEEAMPYFNHYIDKNDVVKQLDKLNCGNTVKVVDEFIATGKLNLAEESFEQASDVVAAKFGKGGFVPVGPAQGMPTFVRLQHLMNKGIGNGNVPVERVVVRGFNGAKYKGSTEGYYFNAILKNGELKIYDGQTGEIFNFESSSKIGSYLKQWEKFEYLISK